MVGAGRGKRIVLEAGGRLHMSKKKEDEKKCFFFAYQTNSANQQSKSMFTKTASGTKKKVSKISLISPAEFELI